MTPRNEIGTKPVRKNCIEKGDTLRAKGTLILAVIVTFMVAACPSIWQTKAAVEKPSADKLFQKAESLFEKGSYRAAIESYNRLKSAYPEFEKMPQVYLRIADAYFRNKEFITASAKYKNFLQLYPKDENASRAKYMIALGYFNKIRPIDRDSRMIEKAAQAFKKVVDEAEDGEWKNKAKEKYKECMKKLGEKELLIANDYYKRSKYKAARKVAQRVLDKYPDLGLNEEAKRIIEKSKGR